MVSEWVALTHFFTVAAAENRPPTNLFDTLCTELGGLGGFQYREAEKLVKNKSAVQPTANKLRCLLSLFEVREAFFFCL